ncbi:Probable inactive leucine-rich repeat receptor kinase XIAO [Linum perenne]
MTKQKNHCSHFLLFISLIFVSTISQFDSRTFPADVQVLRNLKDGLDPNSIPSGSCLSSWDFSVDPCDRVFSDKFTCGLRCDRAVSDQFRVTEITLDSVGYSGFLSSTNWSLPYLQTLDLSDNSFSGSLPDSLSNLIQLRRLGLSRNFFSGQIPSSLGSLSNLEELYLDSNLLSGPIPVSFSSLTSLKRLEIQGNNLYGEFPDLRSLHNLYYLDASNNKFSHEFDRSTFPTSLIELSIRNNSLRGNVPENVLGLKYLQVLDLSHNRLSGTIVSVLFGHPSLQQLTLSHNDFTFLQVPRTMGFKSELIAVDLSHNDLRGLLPAFLCSMPKLSALSLEDNRFTGMIPPAYAVKVAAVEGGETAAFERLLLGGNYLFGSIPTAMLGMKAGSANVSLVDNCLYRCPNNIFFCRGGDQKSLVECKRFWPVVIP